MTTNEPSPGARPLTAGATIGVVVALLAPDGDHARRLSLGSDDAPSPSPTPLPSVAGAQDLRCFPSPPDQLPILVRVEDGATVQIPVDEPPSPTGCNG